MAYVIKCHFCLLSIALLCSFWAVFPFKHFALLYLTKYHFIYFKKFPSSIFLYLWKNASRKERYSLTMSIQYTRRIDFPCIWCRLKQDYKSIQLWWIYFLANLLTKRCIFISPWLRENYNLISADKFLYPNFYHFPNSILVQFSFHSFHNFCRPFLNSSFVLKLHQETWFCLFDCVIVASGLHGNKLNWLMINFNILNILFLKIWELAWKSLWVWLFFFKGFQHHYIPTGWFIIQKCRFLISS